MRNVIQVMQVLRLPPMGKLVIDVSDKRYESWADITDDNVRRLLLAAIGELVGYVGGYEKLVDAGMAPPLMSSAAPTAFAPSAAPQPTIQEQQAAFLASLEAQRDALLEAPPPRKPSIVGGLRPKPLETPAPEGKASVVEQIDAILQRHLAADPNLLGRSIHLEPDPEGGLQIEVDGTYYKRPAEIKDPNIQIHIKRALEEWESP